jgi:2-keto-4-pentenoate hydratase/2-oxohepta-3-ene-1,7-dioic acid hydratase in catechol pathway
MPSSSTAVTKRYTSIIAHQEDILLHPKFTQTADYEGEIGVIIGKAGFRIDEKNALDHVWGYTIINDVTARERQRDHKQFYIGKSPDTFCPMVRCGARRLLLFRSFTDYHAIGTDRCTGF